MAIQTFFNFSNLKTIPDLTRFLTSFSSQVATQVNLLISTKTISGVIGISGTILAADSVPVGLAGVSGSIVSSLGVTSAISFGASLVSTGVYYLKFTPPFSTKPSVVATIAEAAGFAAQITITGITMTGCTVNSVGVVGFANVPPTNSVFCFFARGGS